MSLGCPEDSSSEHEEPSSVTTPSARFIQALQQAAELEWYRYTDKATGRLQFVPPLLVWRYRKDEPRLDEALQTTVDSFRGRVKWLFELQGRNWVLAPDRLIQLQQERRLPTDSVAVRTLAEEDPSFSEAALMDLDEITNRLLSTLAG
jgi:hypothetical protein